MSSRNTTTERSRALSALLNALEELRNENCEAGEGGELSVNALIAFLYAAQHNGEWRPTDIAKHMSLSLTTPARWLQAMEEWGAMRGGSKKRGFHFLQNARDPSSDSRSKVLQLTPDGTGFVNRMLNHLVRLTT